VESSARKLAERNVNAAVVSTQAAGFDRLGASFADTIGIGDVIAKRMAQTTLKVEVVNGRVRPQD
jgi:hypothetical protein